MSRDKIQQTIDEAGISSEELEAELPHIEEINSEDARDLNTPPPRIPEGRIRDLVELTAEVPERKPFLDYDEDFFLKYQNRIKNKTNTKGFKKPNAGGKLWKKIHKRPSDNASIKILPNFDERSWLKRFSEIKGFPIGT